MEKKIFCPKKASKNEKKTNEKAPKRLIPDEKLSQSDWRIPVGKLTDFH